MLLQLRFFLEIGNAEKRKIKPCKNLECIQKMFDNYYEYYKSIGL